MNDISKQPPFSMDHKFFIEWFMLSFSARVHGGLFASSMMSELMSPYFVQLR